MWWLFLRSGELFEDISRRTLVALPISEIQCKAAIGSDGGSDGSAGPRGL
jgi:hypothetical protein